MSAVPGPEPRPTSAPLDAARIDIVDLEVSRILRAKSGMERLRLAHEAWDLAWARLTAFLHARHPEWDREEVRRQVARRLGHESG